MLPLDVWRLRCAFTVDGTSMRIPPFVVFALRRGRSGSAVDLSSIEPLLVSTSAEPITSLASIRPFEVVASGGNVLRGEVSGAGPAIVQAHGITAARKYVTHGSKLLQRRGRLTYRALKRQFGLDDAVLENLKEDHVRPMTPSSSNLAWLFAVPDD